MTNERVFSLLRSLEDEPLLFLWVHYFDVHGAYEPPPGFDHGESLGEHGIYFKHIGLHDPVTRVPLIVRGPGVPAGERVSSVVSTLGIAPTLLEYAMADELDRARGESLRPFLYGWPAFDMWS